MQYRRFGKTELMLPVITCGGMRFQESWKADDPITEAGQANVEACVKRALDVGIYHFETARGYGSSEKQLGRILPQLPRDEIIVQTKVNPEADVDVFVSNFNDSMARLQLDYLDIFSVHGINNDETLEHALKCMDPIQQWMKEGRIRHLGFASHGTADILIKTIETGLFESMNMHWFYINQNNWPAIETAHRHDVGVYIISPNDKGGMLHSPSERLLELCDPLHPMMFNDLFCLARPEVHSLSCGVAKAEEFDIHLDAVARLDEADTLLPPIVKRLEDAMVERLGQDWVDTWQVGLPHWKNTPGEVNIHTILWLRNLALAYDMVEYGKMRYNFLGNGGHWFPGEEFDKLPAGTDLAPLLKDSPNAEQIPAALEEIHALLKGEEVKRLQQDP